VLDLRKNYIGTLTNDSFVQHDTVKTLLLSFNRVHTVEPGSLRVLRELETLDLSQNALKVVPAGLPGSLVTLYLNGNPLSEVRNLDGAVDLKALHLRRCELNGYPALPPLSKLVELDVSDNGRITLLDPAQLAVTCRLSKLNVTNTKLFVDSGPESRCQCRRVAKWAREHAILVFGAVPCPNGVDVDGPNNETCQLASDAADDAFDTCKADAGDNTPLAMFVKLTISMVGLQCLMVYLCHKCHPWIERIQG